MTKNKKWKQHVRAFADATGMRYTAARRALLARQETATTAPTGTPPVVDSRLDDTSEQSRPMLDSRAASGFRIKPPHLAPAASLDYARACTLAKQVYGLLVSTSELAWQIYGVKSPQGRDGDQILSKGQYLKNLLRADAFDSWVPKGSWEEEGKTEKLFRRFYPPPTGVLAELSEEAQLHYRGRGSRGRCPKVMPMEAHRAIAQAHQEAEDALRQLEALLSPHQRHPGTSQRLKACRRLAVLAGRQRVAFRAALDAAYGTTASAQSL